MKTPERGVLAEIGLTAGTLGSTAGQTVMVAVFPVILAEYAPSAFWVGLAIGGEGLLALAVPYWIGALSDRLPERLVRTVGRRAFFLLASAPIMALSLVAAPLISGYWPLVAVAVVFFAAFHIFLTPLWTLMVDAVPDERRGRVQGVRGVLHAIGLGYGLVAGGLLLSVWTPLPFLLAAA
ncbi:MAG: MFS transporter, partial [Longimicrobiales bacterium]